YGTQISFTTLASCTCASTATCPSTVTDRESNSYDVLTLGGQCWMKQTLRVTTLNDGTAIPVDAGGGTTGNGAGYTGWATTTTSAMTVYEHNASNLTTYGYLYNQYAVNDSKGLCPSGWRVPTHSEWTTLTTCLGGELVAGEKMKVVGTTYWTVNYFANNCTDFSGLPGGFRRSDGLFYFKGANAYFWTSTSAKNRALDGANKELRESNDAMSYSQNVGLSVRCIKN
ncbi:MAG: fibrobacter succinogenes major paralogous domain-containing protein, partial [Bacteroidota bacterium]